MSMDQDRCETHQLPPGAGRYSVTPETEYDCEEILLALETFLRKGDHQIQYRAGRFRVRLVDRDNDAVSYSADLTVALEGALRNVGALQ